MSNEAVLLPDQRERGARGGRLTLLGGLVAVTLLAVAAGAGIAFLIASPAPPAAPEGAETVPQNPAQYAAVSGPLTLVPLDPVITNVSSPPAVVLRVDASLVLRADTQEDPAILAAQVSADTLVFARSLDLAQIEGSRGLMHLREDLKERAMLRSSAVADYVIHSLVVQ